MASLTRGENEMVARSGACEFFQGRQVWLCVGGRVLLFDGEGTRFATGYKLGEGFMTGRRESWVWKGEEPC